MHNRNENARFEKLGIIFMLVLFLTIGTVGAKCEDSVILQGYNDARLYIREKPDRSSDKVGAYEAFSLIEVLEDLGGWYRVRDGFVMSKFVYPLVGSPYEKLILNNGNYTKADMKKDNMPRLKMRYIGFLDERVKGEGVTKGGYLYFVGAIPIYDIIDGYAYFPSGRNIYRIQASTFISFDEVGDDKDIVAAYRTVYFSSTDNRKYNIALVSSIIDGTIIKAGETFSYNNITGPRGKNEGYRLANVISNGQLVEGYGGGVCQVSSTIYAAVMNNNHFKIVSRKPHSLEVTYLPLGMDATVSYKSTDFSFKNTYDFDVMINIYAQDGVCLVTIEKVN